MVEATKKYCLNFVVFCCGVEIVLFFNEKVHESVACRLKKKRDTARRLEGWRQDCQTKGQMLDNLESQMLDMEEADSLQSKTGVVVVHAHSY
jgi:hypothetical protein